jgi:transcriptional regulator with XRE-family HTH domain
MRRNTDTAVAKKIGSVIRMRRMKLGMSQRELGAAIDVRFQQIQKYETGLNAVGSTSVVKLCRALEMTPNELFGAGGKMDDDASRLSTWGIRVALNLQQLLPPGRRAITALLVALPKQKALRQTNRKRRKGR